MKLLLLSTAFPSRLCCDACDQEARRVACCSCPANLLACVARCAVAVLQVPLLLKDMHIEMRTLGAELLAVFTRVQSQVDCQLDAIQVHVPQVRCISCRRTGSCAVTAVAVTMPAAVVVSVRPHPLAASLSSIFCALVCCCSFVDCLLHLLSRVCCVLQVCRAAQAALSADRKEQRLQEAAERRRQGDKLAVPNPLDLMARR